MKRLLFIAVMLTALVQSQPVHADTLGSDERAGEGADPPSSLHASVRSGRLTLHAVNASLQDVLALIGKQAGIKVSLRGDLDFPVTRSFSNASLGPAIGRLLGKTSFVMLYGKSKSAAGPARLMEIRVGSVRHGAPVEVARDEVSQDQSVEAAIARRAATLRLGEVSKEDQELYDELANLDSARRSRVMNWLAERGDEGATRVLGRFLALDSDPAVRSEAVLALRDIGGESASESLTLGLGDRDPDVRIQVVEALGTTAGDQNAFLLGRVLYSESDPDVRMSAIVGLATLRGDAARHFLEAATTEDLDEKVRETADYLLHTWD